MKFCEAGSGLEAIERLALMSVDLMILDLNMPEMHGIEVLQFVRAHKTYRDLPVVVLTTREIREVVKRRRPPVRRTI